jgi:hypothetical protein
VQQANARIFRNLAVRSRPLSAARSLGLRAAARVPGLPARLAAGEALLDLRLPVDEATDRPRDRALRPMTGLGGWRSGRRLPFQPLPGGGSLLDRVGATHTCFVVGADDPGADAHLLAVLRRACPLPIDPAATDPAVARAWRVPGVHGPAAALVRPDQEVAGLFQLATGPERSRP